MRNHITATLLLILLTSVPVLSQGSSETFLLRENRRLRYQVDSLERVISLLGAVDPLWADLSGLDEENDSPLGEGFSSLDENPYSEEEAAIASSLRKVFPTMGIAYRKEVGEKVSSYSRGVNAARLERAFKRLDRWMPLFRKTFGKYGVPEELIPLCIVESAASRQAVSPVGAAGVWQLMPVTAEGYGLRVSTEQDERFDVEKSTEVAARILRDLRRSLGSWPLAVMAYNCGSGRVRQAMIAGESSEPWDVWEKVPRETRDYLPSLLAVGYLMSQR